MRTEIFAKQAGSTEGKNEGKTNDRVVIGAVYKMMKETNQ